MAGMVSAPPVELPEQRPLIAATHVRRHHAVRHGARARRSSERGYEVLVFHATGTGGARDGGADRLGASWPACSTSPPPSSRDELVGGVLSAGPGPARGRRAARASRRSSRSARSTWSTSARATRCRRSSRTATCTSHNPSVTLMRTTPEECAELGRIDRGQAVGAPADRWRCSCRCAASRRSTSKAARSTTRPPTQALFAGAARRTSARHVELHELDAHINDPEFADAMARQARTSSSRRRA